MKIYLLGRYADVLHKTSNLAISRRHYLLVILLFFLFNNNKTEKLVQVQCTLQY